MFDVQYVLSERVRLSVKWLQFEQLFVVHFADRLFYGGGDMVLFNELVLFAGFGTIVMH
ncbi:MAG: hypothetical protein Q7R47_00940 [Candidatus Diapherotrites archaeon]|nr:hypothetical protein [Candidatus Diapherotrites archaeon]